MTLYEDNDVFGLASCFEPRFKLHWCRDAVKSQLYVKAACTLASHKEDSTVSSPAKKRSKLFSFMSEGISQPSSVKYELNQYLGEAPLAEGTDILEEVPP